MEKPDLEKLLEDLKGDNIFQGSFQWEFQELAEQKFIEWFIENGLPFDKVIETVSDSITIKQSTGTQCFHNSQLLSYLNDGLEYFEGIIFGPEYKSCWHHGFVINKEKEVIDITFIKNPKNYESLRDKRFVYFGVKIPIEFIRKKEKIFETSDIHNPLLIEYYNHSSAPGNL